MGEKSLITEQFNPNRLKLLPAHYCQHITLIGSPKNYTGVFNMRRQSRMGPAPSPVSPPRVHPKQPINLKKSIYDFDRGFFLLFSSYQQTTHPPQINPITIS